MGKTCQWFVTSTSTDCPGGEIDESSDSGDGFSVNSARYRRASPNGLPVG
jgi:hypothetical protein